MRKADAAVDPHVGRVELTADHAREKLVLDPSHSSSGEIVITQDQKGQGTRVDRQCEGHPSRTAPTVAPSSDTLIARAEQLIALAEKLVDWPVGQPWSLVAQDAADAALQSCIALVRDLLARVREQEQEKSDLEGIVVGMKDALNGRVKSLAQIDAEASNGLRN